MGRRRKKPTIVPTSWESWGSFDYRGLGDFDIASQYYFQSVFSALDTLWSTFTETQKIWHQLQAVEYWWIANTLLWSSWYLHLNLIPGPLSCPEQGLIYLLQGTTGLCSSNSCDIYFSIGKRTKQLFERGANTDWTLDRIASKALPCSPRLCCPAAEWNLLFWV